MKAVVVDYSMLGSTQGMLVRGIVHNPLYSILVCTLDCHIPLLSVSIFLQSNYPSSPEHVGAHVLRRTRNSVVLLPFGTTVLALSSHPPSLHQLQPNFCCFPFTAIPPPTACMPPFHSPNHLGAAATGMIHSFMLKDPADNK